MFDKLEALRLRLEERMGSDNLLRVHNLVKKALQNKSSVTDVQDKLGPKYSEYVALLLQMVQLETLTQVWRATTNETLHLTCRNAFVLI